MKSVEIKIAYIGGGSRYWARDLITELALTPRLKGWIDLYDLDHAAAERNVAVAGRIYRRPEAVTHFTVRAVRRLADALKGADFVVLSIEPGPTEMRFADLVSPERHGILQPVGDTTGPGGIARALRAIPLYHQFGRAIAEHCPRAWVINYTNPMTLCTAALYAAAPAIKAFGCCHEVFHTQHDLARFVARWFGVPRPPRQAIRLDIAGVNHFTWTTAATWEGHDLFPKLRETVADPTCFRSRRAYALGLKRRQSWFEYSGIVALDLFHRFGALGSAGDRHLVEFVPWYATSEENLHRWGVILTPYWYRLARSRLPDHDLAHYSRTPIKASEEEGVRMIEALVGLQPLDTNVNLPNRGQMTEAPLGVVVETYAQLRRNRATPVAARPLPSGAQALVRRIIDVQALTLQAALARDVDLAFQALLADPLVRISTDHAWKMFTAMLRHLRPGLPGWRIP
jgi:alpha-galactosidase/6-phospho-beta-glucosidase family protein